MNEIERPPFPWVGIVLGVLALVVLVAVVQAALGFLFGLVRLALVVGAVAVVAYLVVTRAGRRR